MLKIVRRLNLMVKMGKKTVTVVFGSLKITSKFVTQYYDRNTDFFKNAHKVVNEILS